MRGYLGNQAKSRPQKSGNKGKGGNRRRRRRPQHTEFPDDGNIEVIPPEQLEASKNAMSLTDLKSRPAGDLVKLGEELGLEGLARQRKQEMIFSILKAHADKGEDIYGDGVLEILQDGFGFLRSPLYNYLPCTEDIYVSPSQIRRFGLRSGDYVEGEIRPPKEKERFFALLKVDKINGKEPDRSKRIIPFEHLTPLFPDERLTLEVPGNKDVSTRVMDLLTNIIPPFLVK